MCLLKSPGINKSGIGESKWRYTGEIAEEYPERERIED
jgi:hypothetical protein